MFQQLEYLGSTLLVRNYQWQFFFLIIMFSYDYP